MKLYNTLTNKQEIFKPLKKNTVKLYVCGITPYDTTHLGHAFTYMMFDVLYRYFKLQKYQVNYTQNVTDIDDDILKKAKAVGKDWKELGNFWTDKYRQDMKSLNILNPTHYVKATETMPTIIDFITELVTSGYAYEKNGNVYFDTQKDSDYGKLSKYSREQMITLSKERGANPDDPNKKDPLDFIVWQKSKKDEPFWVSPLGKGRPGWHIECSAMAYKYVDKKLDIHGGGGDLIYPHHESEIAQSEAFTGMKPFSKFWMHIGMVRYQGEKMSKSLGNLVMVSDLLKTYSPNAIRYLLLSHHYREPWEYYKKDLDKAAKSMEEIEIKIKEHKNSEETKKGNYFKEFSDELDNDFNTPLALKIIDKTLKNGNITEAIKMLEVLGFTV
jgi:L-cysteine:1D-myo-inositol 2-amino-2-deoxy-alpha-D-glucopyranoside ligase